VPPPPSLPSSSIENLTDEDLKKKKEEEEVVEEPIQRVREFTSAEVEEMSIDSVRLTRHLGLSDEDPMTITSQSEMFQAQVMQLHQIEEAAKLIAAAQRSNITSTESNSSIISTEDNPSNTTTTATSSSKDWLHIPSLEQSILEIQKALYEANSLVELT